MIECFMRIVELEFEELNIWKRCVEKATQDRSDTYWKSNGIVFGIKSISYCAALTPSIDINWFHQNKTSRFSKAGKGRT